MYTGYQTVKQKVKTVYTVDQNGYERRCMEKFDPVSRFHREVVAYYIQKYDLNRVGDMVGGMFADDASLQYLLGDVSEKARSRYCRTTYRSMFGDAIMISTDSEIDNLIVLCPPGYRGIPTMRFLRNGGLATVCRVGLDAVKRSIAFEKNAVEIRTCFFNEKTWYLMTFAARAGKTHHGLGSEILRPVLDWMDKNHYSVYLETHKTVNVEMYRHFGFRIADTCFIPGSEVKQYGMLRPAR